MCITLSNQQTQWESNPYIGVIDLPAEKRKEVLNILPECYIDLTGGIGDQIEQISKIWTQKSQDNSTIKLCTSKTRINQLRRIVQGARWIDDEDYTKKRVNFHLMMSCYGVNQPKASSFINITPKRNKHYQLMFCWNAVGKGDIVSRWMRSVEYTQVVRLYRRLRTECSACVNILDISQWNKWELETIKNLNVTVLDPSEGDLYDLTQLVQNSRLIFSIDTALVHLCSAMNKKVNVLLPYVNDERWNENLKINSSYQRTCNILQQKAFNEWNYPLEWVIKIVKEEINAPE